jgi:hypothetical protein
MLTEKDRHHRYLWFCRDGMNAAAVDKRVKAVAVTSMYNMSRVMANEYSDALTPELRSNT